LRSAVNDVRAAGTCQRFVSDDVRAAFVVLWAQVLVGTASSCVSVHFGSVCGRSGLLQPGAVRLGGGFASAVAPVAG
jgi:hypothetical protein